MKVHIQLYLVKVVHCISPTFSPACMGEENSTLPLSCLMEPLLDSSAHFGVQNSNTDKDSTTIQNKKYSVNILVSFLSVREIEKFNLFKKQTFCSV